MTKEYGYSIEQYSIEQWIDLITQNELPAITSTAKMLDGFANDDKSSLPKLSEAILHDQALSSCLLKVANNLQHISVNKVTTVSRATVVLGIQTVKNICLTAKLVSSLLASNSLDINVYERLTELMANSFYAGMLAKMMVPNYSEELQEEVYLAAMLYRIGETAFWSSGGEVASQLANYQAKSTADFDAFSKQLLGNNFSELSKGLAKTWNLSDLLVKALDQPEARTDEIKVIFYADKLSAIIAKPEGCKEDYQTLLADIAGIMNISEKQLLARVDYTRQQASTLLASYGAEILTEHIKPVPSARDFAEFYNPTVNTSIKSSDTILLDGILQLTSLMKTNRDFNSFLQLAMQCITDAYGINRCSFLMLDKDKSSVKSRLIVGNNVEPNTQPVLVKVKQSDNVIARVITTDTAVFINDYKEVRWQNLITEDIEDIVSSGQTSFVPVKIANSVIGVICLQVFIKEHKLSNQNFKQVCGLVEHLNMCLTMLKLA
jgi:HD-like signal output (HDOD) protein